LNPPRKAAVHTQTASNDGRDPVVMSPFARRSGSNLDMTTARAIGLDPGLFASGLSGPLTPNAEAYVRPMIEKAAFVWSVDDAWAMLAAFALLGVLVVPFAWRTKQASAVAIKGN
jgi:hypothetical protein